MKDLKEAYKTIEARGFHPQTPKTEASPIPKVLRDAPVESQREYPPSDSESRSDALAGVQFFGKFA